jgi:hypothetical protein
VVGTEEEESPNNPSFLITLTKGLNNTLGYEETHRRQMPRRKTSDSISRVVRSAEHLKDRLNALPDDI